MAKCGASEVNMLILGVLLSFRQTQNGGQSSGRRLTTGFRADFPKCPLCSGRKRALRGQSQGEPPPPSRVDPKGTPNEK